MGVCDCYAVADDLLLELESDVFAPGATGSTDGRKLGGCSKLCGWRGEATAMEWSQPADCGNVGADRLGRNRHVHRSRRRARPRASPPRTASRVRVGRMCRRMPRCVRSTRFNGW
jgi:hypothetical protein